VKEDAMRLAINLVLFALDEEVISASPPVEEARSTQ